VPAAALQKLLDVLRVRRVDLVDDQQVGHAEVGFAGVVQRLVPGPVGVEKGDVKVGLVERRVVVTPVPEDDLGLLLGLAEDLLVVDAGVDDEAVVDVGLVLLPLFDGGLVAVEVLVGGEALGRLLDEVAVGHRMADGHDLLAEVAQDAGEVARGLRLADAGAHGGDGDDGLRGAQHGPGGRAEAEARPPAHHGAPLVHDVEMGDVGVGEPDLVHAVLADQRLELLFGANGDTVRIERSGQLGRVRPPLDVRDLRGGKGHDLAGLVAAKQRVEVVKVPPRRTHDDDFPPGHMRTSSRLNA
jgi:hypothetical protein